MRNLVPFALLFLSVSTFAQTVRLRVLGPVQVLNYELGIGSKVELKLDSQTLKGIFLGRMPDHPEFGDEFLVLDEETEQVLLVDTESIKTSSVREKAQPVISTIDQAGETCAAYAIYHFWRQLSQSTESEVLKESFSIERSRMKFLEEAITRYYMGRTFNLNTILNNFGKRFGYRCRDKVFEDGESAVAHVFEQGQAGRLVLMEFNIGPSMVESENSLVDYETGVGLDPELWVPRKVGERNAGGHAIVAAGAFMHKGKRKLVVLDSNWNEPRVWDAEAYLKGKVAIDEMVFHTCY